MCRLLLVGIGWGLALAGQTAWAQAAPNRAAVAEDAREERLLILKTADQIDLLRGNSDKLQASVSALEAELVKLREENLAFRQELAALKAALEQAEAARAKERETLLAEIAKLVAAKPAPAAAAQAGGPASAANAPAPERGFYHVVEKGQTLSLIAKAYREQGVHTSVEAIRKANSLAADGTIRVGQKLFIPKG